MTCPNAGKSCSCPRVSSAWHHAHSDECARVFPDCDHGGSVKINAGGGDKLGRERGYINLDIRKLPKTDLGATVASLPFASNTADEIVCSDLLEHIPRHQLMAVLNEVHRVLKAGGTLKIKMPDLRALAELYLAGRIDTAEYARKIYGNQEEDNDANFHKSGMDPLYLSKSLEAIGFWHVTVKTLDGEDLGNMGARATKYGAKK